MSKTFIFYPNEGTQEVVKKIQIDTSTPVANFATSTPNSKHLVKGNNLQSSTRGSKPFHNKKPK